MNEQTKKRQEKKKEVETDVNEQWTVRDTSFS